MEQIQIYTDLHKKYPPLTCRLYKLHTNSVLEKHLAENHCKIADRFKKHDMQDFDLKFDMPCPTITDFINDFINKTVKQYKEEFDKWFIKTLECYGVEESEILQRVEVITQNVEDGTDIYHVNIDGQHAFSFKKWIENDFDYKNPYVYTSNLCIKIL